MAHLILGGKFRAFKANGEPAAGYKLYSYRAGTSTLMATYTDKDEGTPNANPVVLDANGEANVWLGENTGYAYKLVLKSDADVPQWTTDKIASGVNDGSITTVKLADGSVTTDKLADGSVTQEKLAEKIVGEQAQTVGTITSTTPDSLTGALSFETTGRPVLVGLVGRYSGAEAYLKVSGPAGAGAAAIVEIYRGTTRLSSQVFGVKPSRIFQAFTSGGTYVVPAGVTELWVNAAGGGGGGCSAGDQTTGGGGGGGSAVRNVRLTVVPGETLTIALGAGGSHGVYGSNAPVAGSAGGDTTITGSTSGLIFKARGGRGGGTGGASGAGWGEGGAGGAAHADGEAARFNASILGGAGGVNGGSASGGGGGGAGLSGVGGDGGIGRSANPGTAGSNGTNYGSGGGGSGGSDDGTRSASGGDGAGGYLELMDAPSLGGTHEFYIPASAIQIIDTTGVAGAITYSIKAAVLTEGATLTGSGEVDLQAVEL